MKLKLLTVEVQQPSEFETAFARLMRDRPDALIVTADSVHQVRQAWILDLAAKRRLPVMYQLKAYVEAGGLMSYGTSLTDLWRRAAIYVDKVLKGAKPPGLTIPQSVLLRADQVLQ